jgi:site-specific recombinase XerC
MASIFKPKGKTKYIIFYTDENGRRRKKVGTTDKGVTQRIARDLENRAALRREGLIDPRSDAYATHEARPVVDHLADFGKALEAAGRTPRHTQMTTRRAEKMVDLAGVRRISELSLSKAQAAVAILRGEGLGAETRNHYIRAVKAFSRWLWKDGRAREHALAHFSTSNPEADRRHQRRALTPEEAGRLIRAAESGPVVKGISGPDRAMAYKVAVGTGFRADELRSLTPESFRLDSEPPTVVCEAGYTKNGHRAEQPVADTLASILRPWVASRTPGESVFNLPAKTAEMIRVDLEAAGIPYETASGLCDFHALRGTYVSHLVSSGASVKTCQTLARHATPSLTIGLYAKASLHDIAGAVESLPDLTALPPKSETIAATGTDGRSAPSATCSATQLPDGGAQTQEYQGGYVECVEEPKSYASASSATLAFSVGSRQDTPKPAGTQGFRPVADAGISEPSRQQPPTSVPIRPQTATQNATRALPDDADLTDVIDAWPALPEAVKAGIMAMVKASVPSRDHRDSDVSAGKPRRPRKGG